MNKYVRIICLKTYIFRNLSKYLCKKRNRSNLPDIINTPLICTYSKKGGLTAFKNSKFLIRQDIKKFLHETLLDVVRLKGESKAFRSTHCFFSSQNLRPSILFEFEHTVQSQSCNLKSQTKEFNIRVS